MAQSAGERKSLETAAELLISVVCWIGDLTPLKSGRLLFIGGIDVRLVPQLPGKSAAGVQPSQPLWLASIMRVDISL